MFDGAEIVVKYGVIGLCMAVIWFGVQREKRQAKESTAREDRAASAFKELNDRSHEAHLQLVQQMTQLNGNMNALREDIHERLPWTGAERRRS